MRRRWPAVLVIVSVFHLVGCEARDSAAPRQRSPEAHTSTADGNWKNGCPDHYDPATDYFPDKTIFQYSNQLHVEYHKSYKIVDFSPSLHLRDPLRYVLYQCGTPKPQGYGNAQLIEVPAQRAVLNDTAFGGAFVDLGILDKLFAVNDAEAYTDPQLNEAIESGKVRALGTRPGSTIEMAVDFAPDVVFLFYSAAPNANLHPGLVSLGVHGIPMGDHFESTELGRSEWLKFLALFFNREAEAQTILGPRIERYNQLLQLAATATTSPKVMLGFPASTETWSGSGSRNVFAQLVRDAHGTYFLSNDETNSNVRLSFEKALYASDDATVWIGINGVNRVANLKALVKPNPQLASMGPLRQGHVYALDLGMTKGHAFPFNSESLDRPDDVLADYILAIHPELLPDTKPVFLRELK